MISVAEALQTIVTSVQPVGVESVGLGEAQGRVLAADVSARVTQPPVALSAMDGYAVRSVDLQDLPVSLIQVGEAPAGGAYDGVVGCKETVRIFTGGPLPAGADAIVIQEDVIASAAGEGAEVRVEKAVPAGHYVRPAGLDFKVGDVGLRAGHRLTARDIGLAAAMNVPWLSVRRRPRVALLATGNEIVRPGEPIAANQIVSSNSLALAALVRACGGEVMDLGIAHDDLAALRGRIADAKGVDLLVTLGGASVGAHDLVQSALSQQGMDLEFWKIAMRPGKPLMFGQLNGMLVLGLPGNPVSSLICGIVFLRPAIQALHGLPQQSLATIPAILTQPLPQNDAREDYLRATLNRQGQPLQVTPYNRQDSSMLSHLAHADALIVRKPFAPAADVGATVSVVPLSDSLYGI